MGVQEWDPTGPVGREPVGSDYLEFPEYPRLGPWLCTICHYLSILFDIRWLFGFAEDVANQKQADADTSIDEIRRTAGVGSRIGGVVTAG